MAGHDVVVIGGSAGAIEALRTLVRELPADLPATVFIVVHTAPDNPGHLAALLSRAGRLPVALATDGAPIHPGRIHVAVPDRHLLLERDRMRLVRGPRENGFRPAIDPLFRTAARAFGPRVIGVVLSGGLDDGTLGLARIKRAGGIAIVQDPEEALVPSMPVNAMRGVAVDHVLRAAAMAATIPRLARIAAANGGDPMAEHGEADPVELGPDALQTGELKGPPSPFTCPECGGTLWERQTGGLAEFRCHVGHGYSADALLSAQANNLEDALWTALRALEEHAELQRKMCGRARQGGLEALADGYDRRARETETRARVLRDVLIPREPTAERSA